MTAVAARIRPLFASKAPAQVLAVALTLLCLVLLVRLAWLFVAGPSLPVPEAGAAPSGPREPVRALSTYPLFGAAAGPPDARQLAPSRSGLLLRGTVAAAEGGGVALIASADGGGETGYRVGDPLPDGARLHRVYPERVVIERAGALETLALPRLGEGAVAVAAPSRPAPVAAQDDASGGFLTAPLRLGRPQLNSARAAAAPDLARLVAEANLIPVLEGGRLVGVRLQLPDPALLDRLGLHGEDVITTVNGIPLDGPERREALEASLRQGGPVELTVRRDGLERQLTIGL